MYRRGEGFPPLGNNMGDQRSHWLIPCMWLVPPGTQLCQRKLGKFRCDKSDDPAEMLS